jgi:hypothetical protein
LPTLLCFNFFPTAQNILKYGVFTNTFINKNDVSNYHRTNGTFGFARPQADPSAKPKEPFFANALTKIVSLPIDKNRDK